MSNEDPSEFRSQRSSPATHLNELRSQNDPRESRSQRSPPAAHHVANFPGWDRRCVVDFSRAFFETHDIGFQILDVPRLS